MYPYIYKLKDLVDFGDVKTSRFGEVRSLTNIFISEDLSKKPVPTLYYSKGRDENIEFQLRYIIQTIKGQGESVLAPFSTIIRENLPHGDFSYGELLRKYMNDGDDWWKLKQNSRNNVRMIYHHGASVMHVPPCNLSLIFDVDSDNKEVSLMISARSIDALFGLTNDYIMFRYLLYYIGTLNGLKPKFFSYAISNFHYYMKQDDRVKHWLKYNAPEEYEIKLFSLKPDNFPANWEVFRTLDIEV